MSTQETHFDKLLLTGLIVLFGGVHLWLLLKGVNDTTFSHGFDAFCGALLGLITGVKIGMAINGNSGNGTTSPKV